MFNVFGRGNVDSIIKDLSKIAENLDTYRESLDMDYGINKVKIEELQDENEAINVESQRAEKVSAKIKALLT